MELLKLSRTQYRRLFTKACNDFEKEEHNLTNENKVLRLKVIEEKAKLLIDTETKFREMLFAGNPKEDILEKEIDESESYFDRWRMLENKLSALQSNSSGQNVITTDLSLMQNKLLHYPKIKLPTFDGNVKNWLGFWGQFQKIDQDVNLDNHDKFAFLAQAMEKDSPADDLIKSFPPTGESYDKALKLLQARFGNEELLIEIYVRDLLALVIQKQNSSSLRKLYDQLESKLRALETLGVGREKYGAVLYPLVESALPDETLRAWERIRFSYKRVDAEIDNSAAAKETLPYKSNLDRLLCFLRDEIESEERISLAAKGFNIVNKSVCLIKKDDKSFRKRDSIPSAADLFTTPRDCHKTCIFCMNTHHKSGDCYKAKKLSLQERQSAVEKARCCFLCLRIGHGSNRCKLKVGCFICGKRHHILLCRNLPETKSNEKGDLEGSPEKDEVLANFSRSPKVMLQTLRVIIRGNKTKRMARAIIDSGSQRSYILEVTAKEMGYRYSKKEYLRHALFGGANTDICEHKVYTIRLSNITETYNCSFEALSQSTICDSIPSISKGGWLKQFKDNEIDLADRVEGPIEILIGADVAGKLLTGSIRQLSSGLVAIESKLGWTVMGKNPISDDQESTALFVTNMLAKDAMISDLWALDSLGILDPSEKKNKEELHKAAKEHFLSTVSIDDNNRFVVHLPWLEDHPTLPDNFNLALKRLDNTVRKLKAGNLYESYGEIFKEWEREGIIEIVPRNEMHSPSHYLPHRHVVKENSTTKIRPVFDASAKQKGSPSLNECLEKGLNLIELIPSIMTRFRMQKIGVTADIRKAFLQISLYHRDKNYLRFLWYDEKGHLRYYRHCRVVFGVSCSPFLLGSVIQYHLESTLSKALEDSSKYPVNMVEQLANSFYVDNCLTSVAEETELQKFIQIAKDIMAERKFDLRGWEFTDPSYKSLEPTNILGMIWDRSSDTLSLKVSHIKDDFNEKISKRVILAAAHKIFDPLGIACPVTLLTKLLLQRLWKSKLTWDEDVDCETKTEFTKWVNNLCYLENLKVPRWLKYDHSIRNLSLHFFCDASKLAYSAVAFVRVETKDSIFVQLLRARSRVAPCGKKETTIARLELLAATISARLATEVLKDFRNISEQNIYFWTDSSTVLSWLKRDEAWGLFVNNRVQEIRRLAPIEAWRHISGSLNPADLPSRGCSARQLINSKWWEGPNWLYFPPEDWPKSTFSVLEEEVISERKKEIVSSMTNFEAARSFIPNYFSSYRKTVRVIGWILRFHHNISCKDKITGELTVDEFERAEVIILKCIQSETLQENKLLKKMQTFKDKNGLLRIKTKLLESEESEEFRTPILLSAKHTVTSKLIFEEHKRCLHAGLSTLLARLREKYWIIGVRKLAKQIISKCVICRRHTAMHLEVPFAPLPKDRVTPAHVFEVSGVDYAGPLYLRSNGKAWIVLFTCAVYRAVHFELVESLSTDAFIQALRRFIARRGRISVLYSDNGTNFVGTNNVLKAIDWNKIKSFSTYQQISWKFIPPTAAWWGGWWERMVRMLKELLRRILGKSIVNYEELTTVLCDCEAVINSRPLTYLTSDPNDLIPLTPATFIHGNANSDTTDLDAVDRSYLVKRCKYLQKLREDLRHRFRNEYLALLVHHGHRRNHKIQVGDVVLIGSDNIKRIDWPLGIVEEIYPGRDGVSRVAKLKTSKGEKVRPYQRLYPLEIASRSDIDVLKLSSSKREPPLVTADVSSSESPVPPVRTDVPILKGPASLVRADVPISKSSAPQMKTKSGRMVKMPYRLDL